MAANLSACTPGLRARPSMLLAFGIFIILAITIYLYRESGFNLHKASVIHNAVEKVHDAELPSTEPEYEHNTIIADERIDYSKNASTLEYSSGAFCSSWPDPGNIAIVIKTGATEIRAKVPPLLSTSLRCVHNPLIFSDLEQELGKHHVHDVLSTFDADEVERNPEFEIYRLQKEYMASGREKDLSELSSVHTSSKDWRDEGQSAAWVLDKYKFLHMIERSWQLAPGKDWYLFIEGDTYLSWPNLLQWLPHLNPRDKLYFGNAVRMHEYRELLFFGHGGSGILLSGETVKDFAVTHRGIASRWDARISKMVFGDFVLAAALHEELGVKIIDVKPSMDGAAPAQITFADEMWCKPAVTLHHIASQQHIAIFQNELAHNGSAMLMRDVLLAAFPPGFPTNRTHWNNRPDDVFLLDDSSSGSEPRHSSYEACQMACVRHGKCVQFAFVSAAAEMKCHLSRAIKLGEERPPFDGETWSSGWMMDRIAKWVDARRQCVVQWPGGQR